MFDSCTLQDDELGLFIPHRQVSWLLTLLIFLCLTSFIAGYFMGHKQALSTFVEQLEEDSFADKVNYALYSLSDVQQEVEQEAEEAQQHDVPDEEASTTDQADDVSSNSKETIAQHREKELPEQSQEEYVYVAPVAGFGTLHAAQTFVKRAQVYDPGMCVKKRVSVNKNGKKTIWYQAVTSEFASRQALEDVVRIIKKIEHIAHITIIERKVTRT